MLRTLGLIAVAAASALWLPLASARADFYINYSVLSPSYAISDVALFEQGQGAGGYGITTASDFGVPASAAPTVLTDPFVKTDPIVSSFILGVTSNLPGDAPGQQHLVLVTNTPFALQTKYSSFDDFFPNTDEDTLIGDLEQVYTGEDNQATSDAYNSLFAFSSGDAVSGNGGPIGFGSSDPFTVIAFSDKTIIGSGFAFTTPAGTTPIPEPASLALLGFALVGLAVAVKRQRASGPLMR